MKKFLFFSNHSNEKINSIAILFLRLFIAGMMLSHGIPKILNFNSLLSVFPDTLGIGSQLSLFFAICCEVGCSLLLIFGLFGRLAAFFLLFTMLNAAFIVHANDPFQVKELAFIYLGVYLSLFLLGSGKYSFDNLLFKNKIQINAATNKN